MNKIKKIITSEIQKFLIENTNLNNVYTLYHGTYSDDLIISDKNIWLASDINYSKIWGDNIFEIEIKLNNIFDTVIDLDRKRLTLKQMIRYLKNKKINTDDIEFALRSYLNSSNNYNFWDLIGDKKTIPYMWLSFDIFNSNYDAIKLSEYGYSYSEKNITFYINKPKDKILSIKRII